MSEIDAAVQDQASRQSAAPPAGACAQPNPARTLLLVDDEENILSALKRVLRRDGYRILTANGGEQGLAVLAEHPVDVIVSDQRMPGMTGVEFLRRVKTLHPETVRLVLSGYTDLQSVTDAINEGAIYKFMTKPWDDAILRSNIEGAFRYKEMADENRRLSHEVQAANLALARVNEQLRELLEEKERQVERDETSLSIAQEALQNMLWPVIGLDDEGMIAAANAEADALFPRAAPLLGNAAADSLPPALLALLQGEDPIDEEIEIDSRSFRLFGRAMGMRSMSRGRLILLVPCKAGT